MAHFEYQQLGKGQLDAYPERPADGLDNVQDRAAQVWHDIKVLSAQGWRVVSVSWHPQFPTFAVAAFLERELPKRLAVVTNKEGHKKLVTTDAPPIKDYPPLANVPQLNEPWGASIPKDKSWVDPQQF